MKTRKATGANRKTTEKTTKAKADWLDLFVAIGLHTGLRGEDIDRLTWDNVDFDSHMLVIPRPKISATLTIPLHPELEKALLAARGKATGKYVVPVI